jgi:hypothetical protein
MNNAKGLIERFGLERCGFLTLTFADHVVDMEEAQRRWHSLRTHVLSQRYEAFIVVVERQKSGRVHFHLIVVLPEDIRSGFSFAEAERKIYSSANDALRDEWAFWRASAKRYGFGRTELLPIQSNAEGVGRYLGKYIGKHVKNRKPADKGARLVRYSAGARSVGCKFMFNSQGAWTWRRKLEKLASELEISDYSEFSRRYGPRWGYYLRDTVAAVEVPPASWLNGCPAWFGVGFDKEFQ